MSSRRIAILAIVSFIVAVPLGGFAFGFVNCSGCGWSIPGRILIGCIMAILTTLFGGFPRQNEAGTGEPFNAWPYILSVAVLVFGIGIYREYRSLRRS